MLENRLNWKTTSNTLFVLAGTKNTAVKSFVVDMIVSELIIRSLDQE